jgi:hypothetical protein
MIVFLSLDNRSRALFGNFKIGVNNVLFQLLNGVVMVHKPPGRRSGHRHILLIHFIIEIYYNYSL